MVHRYCPGAIPAGTPRIIHSGNRTVIERAIHMMDIEQIARDDFSRRAFLTRMSAAGLGVAAAALLAGCGGSGTNNGIHNINSTRYQLPNRTFIQGSDINKVVLNFALTLEILEADLYRQALNAASGRALGAGLDANPAVYTQPSGVSNGNLSSAFGAAGYLYLKQFAYVEAAHRDFLIAALGSEATKPNPNGYKFATADGTPGGDIATILANLLPLEETGVRAYLGAAGDLTSLTLIQTAATIYSTEARHSASIEYILDQDPGPRTGITGVPGPDKEVTTAAVASNVFEKYLDPNTVLAAATSVYFK